MTEPEPVFMILHGKAVDQNAESSFLLHTRVEEASHYDLNFVAFPYLGLIDEDLPFVLVDISGGHDEKNKERKVDETSAKCDKPTLCARFYTRRVRWRNETVVANVPNAMDKPRLKTCDKSVTHVVTRTSSPPPRATSPR